MSVLYRRELVAVRFIKSHVLDNGREFRPDDELRIPDKVARELVLLKVAERTAAVSAFAGVERWSDLADNAAR